MPRIEIRTKVHAEKKVVFDLARSVELHTKSTVQTNETAIAGRTQGLMELGESVTWRAKHFGFYQNLTSKITSFDKPNHFTDEMVSGLFKSFKHEHHFEKVVDGTLMTDVFNYVSPFGFLGKMADFFFLRKYMETFLRRRNIVVKDVAESV